MSKTNHRLKALRRRRSKQLDSSCRNHGSCPWCRGNRTHKHRRAMLKARDEG